MNNNHEIIQAIQNVTKAINELNSLLRANAMPVLPVPRKRKRYNDDLRDKIYDTITNLPTQDDLPTDELYALMPKGVSHHLVGRCMREMGWINITRRMDGKVKRVWRMQA